MSVVDEVKDRLDIVEVIQSYMPLRKAGRTYKGLCPFHAEKTPSFVVFPATGTWHCFGACGTGGDAFTFVMQQENLDFGEALRTLARRAGVELEARSPETAKADKKLALLREINEAAADYFHQILRQSEEAEASRNYLSDRGLNQATIARFSLGYALNQWDGLLRHLVGRRYTPADAADAGLVIERDDRSGHYDRFRQRIMFPIRDHRGRTIGFGGRVLGDGVPKYMNSPQTLLFDKSSVLFGLDQAKKGIRTTEEAVIVEGYMDVLMGHQEGFDNIVAQMGTALTEAQLKQLTRHTQRFVLALDSDLAGNQATLRGLDVARQVMDREPVPVPTPRGLVRFEDRLAAEIRIATLPSGQDPDEVIRADPSRWVQLIAQAKPVMDYYFQALTADLDLSTAKGKAEAARLLGPLVAKIGDRVQRTHYLQQLARMVQVDERTLWQQIRSAPKSRQRSRQAREVPQDETHERTALDLDEHCLAFALVYPDLLAMADRILEESDEERFSVQDLKRPQDRAILEVWRQWLENGGSQDPQAEFFDALDETLQQRVAELLQLQAEQPPVADDLLQNQILDAMTRLRLRGLRRQNFELRFLQGDAADSKDKETLRFYVQMNVEIAERIRRLEQAINKRSMTGRRVREDAQVRIPYAEE